MFGKNNNQQPEYGTPQGYNPPPQKPSMGKRILKWAAIIIGIIIVLGIIGMMFGGSDDESSTENAVTESTAQTDNTQSKETTPAASTETESTTQEPAAESKDVYTVGETGTALDVSITLNSVTETTELPSNGVSLAAPEGKEFLVCDFTVVNNSDSDIMITSTSFDTYVDNQSTEASASGMAADNAFSGDLNLAPGRETNGIVAYEVTPGWQTFETEYKPNPFLDDAIKFEVNASQVS